MEHKLYTDTLGEEQLSLFLTTSVFDLKDDDRGWVNALYTLGRLICKRFCLDDKETGDEFEPEPVVQSPASCVLHDNAFFAAFRSSFLKLPTAMRPLHR